MLASNISYEPIKNQTTPNQNQKYGKKQGLGQFLAYSDMLGVKNQHSSWGIQQLIKRARLFGPTCQSILVVYKHIKWFKQHLMPHPKQDRKYGETCLFQVRQRRILTTFYLNEMETNKIP